MSKGKWIEGFPPDDVLKCEVETRLGDHAVASRWTEGDHRWEVENRKGDIILFSDEWHPPEYTISRYRLLEDTEKGEKPEDE